MKTIAMFFSFCSACGLLASTLCKNKKNTYKMQVIDSASNFMANILLQGYSGATTTAVAVIRNYVSMKNKMTIWFQVVLSSLIIVLGLIFNNRGWLGLLPIMASVEYTIVGCYKKASLVVVKLGLLINLIMWAIYNSVIGSYPALVAEVISATLCVISIIKTIKNNGSSKL